MKLLLDFIHQSAQQSDTLPNDNVSQDSDSESIITDYSGSSSLSSKTSIKESIHMDGIDVFIECLFRNGNFRAICHDALTQDRIKRDRLQRKIAKLLRRFKSNLCREKQNHRYSNIPKFIGCASTTIANQILNDVRGASELNESKVRELGETDPKSRVEEYLQSPASQSTTEGTSPGQKSSEFNNQIAERLTRNLEKADSASEDQSLSEVSDAPNHTIGRELKQAEDFLFRSDAFLHLERQLLISFIRLSAQY